MIKIGMNSEMDRDLYEENWLIVRKPDEVPEYVTHEPLLSPSPVLFGKYMSVYKAGTFDQTFFDEVYVPQFIEELAVNEEALSVLDKLVSVSNQKEILLTCYCEVEERCHRSIIAGILLGMGAMIDTKDEYLKYYRMLGDVK